MPEDTGRHAESGYIVRQHGRWWWLGQLMLTGIACFIVFF